MAKILTKNCLFCGKVIIKSQNESLKVWNNKRKYCSKKCADLARIGKPSWNKGKECPKGELANNWRGGLPKCSVCGKKLSIRHPIVGMCRACFNKSRSGKNHYNWKGGITPINHLLRTGKQFKDWQKSVFTRDYWTCQLCGSRKDIHAHHIKQFAFYPELRFELSNGITLCRSCHKKRHKK
jgi:hypothetical protein